MIKLTQKNLHKTLQGLFIESIIHDLNNHLGAISLTVELLEHMTDIESSGELTIDEYYKQIMKQVESGAKIIKDFVVFSSDQHKGFSIFNVKESTEQLFSFSQPRFRKSKIELCIQGVDTVIEANQGDFNLILLYIMYAHIASLNIEKSLSLHIKEKFIDFQTEKTFSNTAELYKNNFFDAPKDLEELLLSICEKNNLNISIADRNFRLQYVPMKM